MIDYESAVKKAKELNAEFDTCTEYENGFMFACNSCEFEIGGSHAPCVILKADGRAVTMPYFVAVVGMGAEIRTFDI